MGTIDENVLKGLNDKERQRIFMEAIFRTRDTATEIGNVFSIKSGDTLGINGHAQELLNGIPQEVRMLPDTLRGVARKIDDYIAQLERQVPTYFARRIRKRFYFDIFYRM